MTLNGELGFQLRHALTVGKRHKGQKRQAPPPKPVRSNVIDIVVALQESLAQKKPSDSAGKAISTTFGDILKLLINRTLVLPGEQGHVIRDSRLQIVIRKRIDLAERRENWPEADISAKEFQSRMRASGVKSYVPTKIVTLKVRLRIGEHVKPAFHRFLEGEKH